MSIRNVDLWIRDLDVRELSPSPYALLDGSERERARALRPGRIRDRWIVGRSSLRVILGRELGVDPESVKIEKGPHGKPFLPDSPVHFNLSHSGPLLAVAVTRGGPVGLDVELVLKMNDMRAVAERICDADERQFLERYESEEERLQAFYRIWTAKEAVLKGAGVGFEVSPSTVHVDVSESTPYLVPSVSSSLEPDFWSLQGFEIPPEGSWAPASAVGTLAFAGDGAAERIPALEVRRFEHADER